MPAVNDLHAAATQRTAGETAVAVFEAYRDSDRDAAEALIAEDFRFFSPLDNGLDRRTYFERCWPGNEKIDAFDFLRVVENGDEAIVTYEARMIDGRRFRNTEVLSARNGQLTRAEVYFGWSVPHEAPAGSFVEPPTK
jgi:ketosteroid isomerase-like protein